MSTLDVRTHTDTHARARSGCIASCALTGSTGKGVNLFDFMVVYFIVCTYVFNVESTYSKALKVYQRLEVDAIINVRIWITTFNTTTVVVVVVVNVLLFAVQALNEIQNETSIVYLIYIIKA